MANVVWRGRGSAEYAGSDCSCEVGDWQVTLLHGFSRGRKKLLAKGHVISDEDAHLLESEGMREVCVTELEEGEVGEDEAVMQVATEIGCESLEIRLAAGGRRICLPPRPVASWLTTNC